MKYLVYLLPLIWLTSCGSDDVSDDDQDLFDRGKMLANWADNIIIPSYVQYSGDISSLKSASEQFAQNTTVSNLQSLRNQWKSAYVSWQSVAMFEIGRAETLGLQGFTNTYPTDAAGIEELIASGVYNLELPSRRDQQGLPALDYLINGLGADDSEIVEVYVNENDGSKYTQFLVDLTTRLDALTQDVLQDWQNGYRDTFVNNDGSAATGAVNKIANDFLFYYEKFLRASKIGIPAGVFSGTPSGDKVEAFYQNDFSSELFNAALDATQDFYNGRHFNSSSSGDGFSDYLVFLNTFKEGEDLNSLINEQFDSARSTAASLSNSYADQVNSNNTLMLNTYDELQKNVVLMKVDMLQALNIRVDYVDADGD